MERLVLKNGEELVLQMSYATLLAVEEKLQCGVMALAGQLAQGMMPMKMMVELVTLCAKPEQEKNRLGENLMECGVTKVAEVLAALLCSVLSGYAGHDNAHGSMRAALQDLAVRFPDC